MHKERLLSILIQNPTRMQMRSDWNVTSCKIGLNYSYHPAIQIMWIKNAVKSRTSRIIRYFTGDNSNRVNATQTQLWENEVDFLLLFYFAAF